MGRKRKLQSPEKMPPSSKQTKVSTEDPEASDADDELQEEQTAADEPITPAKEKRWKEKCRRWIAEQQGPSGLEGSSEPEQDPLEEDEPMLEQHQLMDEPAQLPPDVLQRPLRNRLKGIDEKQILYSVMFECEWEKCGFETDKDMDYMNHVEDHLRAYLRQTTDVDEGLSCFWDLCDYKAPTRNLLESHVHFHVYHSRIKTFGASLGAVIHIPKCNNGSQRRNSIEAYQITFRCEWADCSDEFQKAQYFFQHVNHHVMDQFPVDKKSSKHVLRCEWNNCTQEYTRRSLAIDHMKKHSTERTIGCYNCGAIFVSRLKYIDHCKRQVDYHNREYPCTQCEKLFATKQLMIDHRNIHNKKFACTQCPMKFPSKKALSYHIRYRHIAEKPFQCQLCSHRTVTKGDLDEHVLTHNDRRMFQCEEFGCDASYKCQKSLKRHVDTVHYATGSGIYACHVCPSQYKAGANLSKHLVKVHKFKRPPGYNRFTYRVDDEGIYRLCSSTAVEESPEDGAQPSTSKVKPVKGECGDIPDSGLGPADNTYTSFTIDKVESVTRAKITIELKQGELRPKPVYEKPSPRTATRTVKRSPTGSPCPSPPLPSLPAFPEQPEHSEIPPLDMPKNIDDFTVMKRYLNLEKVVISYEETDATGSVIRSETVETSEISLVRKDLEG